MPRVQKDWGYLDYELRGGNTLEIVNIFVNDNRRREGLGSGLVQEVISKGTLPFNLYVLTRKINTKAIRFYQSLDMTIWTTLPGFYAGCTEEYSDAVILFKRLR